MKIKMKRLSWRALSYIAIVAILAVILGMITCEERKVEAAGGVTGVYGLGSYAYDTHQYHTTTSNYWGVPGQPNEFVLLEGKGVNNQFGDSYTELPVGWKCSTIYSEKFQGYQSMMGFDISAFPVGAQVTGARVKLKVADKQNTGTWDDMYVALYQMDTANTDCTSFNYVEWKRIYQLGSKRLSTVETYSEAVIGEWTTFEIVDMENNFEYIVTLGGGDRIWFSMVSTNHALNYHPGWQAEGVQMDVCWSGYASTVPEADRPIFEIDYLPAAPPREIEVPVNDLEKETPTGEEELTGISWVSPRCAYADEPLAFDFAGESGAIVDAKMFDAKGAVLSEIVDSVRVDGHFYWEVYLGSSKTGFVRVVDETAYSSKWGYVYATPSASQPTNVIMSVDTQYSQWTRSLSDFVTKPSDLMIAHWKTNIDGDDEVNDHSLRWWYLGKSTQEIYNVNLGVLSDDYWEASAENKKNAHWRYALFTMDGSAQGFDDRDGLIIDLERNFDSSTYGFYQPLIYGETASAEFTTTHSAYWYVPNAFDAITYGDLSSFKTGEPLSVSVGVGEKGKVASDLNIGKIEVLSGGTRYAQGGSSLVVGTNTITTDEGVNVPGSYIVRVSLEHGNSAYTHYHDYGAEASGTGGVGGAGGGWLFGWLTGWLEEGGLNNTTGWALFMGIMAVALFFIFRHSAVLRVAGPLGVLAVGIALGWVPIWVVVLLALGAGFMLYKIFHGRVSGGEA